MESKLESSTGQLDYKTYIVQNISENPLTPYKRKIQSVKWISPTKLPYVFHTASSALEFISPQNCQTFDYVLDNVPLPVNYVLTFPHVNRVKIASELWSPTRLEAQYKNGFSHSYLTIAKSGQKPFSQIRLGSTMEFQYLLACKNTGGVFSINAIAEGGIVYSEVISIFDSPVVDVIQYTIPSPIGYATGGRLETHTNITIPTPEIVGYTKFEDALPYFPTQEQHELIDIANSLADNPRPSANLFSKFSYLLQANQIAKLESSDFES